MNAFLPALAGALVISGLGGAAFAEPTWCPDLARVTDARAAALFSGRFVDRKGIWQLIDAIGIVLAAAPEVRFVLAGGHRGCPAEQMAAWLLPDTLWRTVAAVSS